MSNSNKLSAIALLSGGLDSATALALALETYEVKRAVSIIYGQRHVREIQSAQLLAGHYGIPHSIIELAGISEALAKGTALLKNSVSEPPAARSVEQMSEGQAPTYVPGRNTIFLAIAQAIAEAEGAQRIIIGVNQLDYSGYADCREDFIICWNDLAGVSTFAGLRGRAILAITPLLYLSKADIIQAGLERDVPYQLTWSCYRGGELACGTCDSCILRYKGFKEAGSLDPIPYETIPE